MVCAAVVTVITTAKGFGFLQKNTHQILIELYLVGKCPTETFQITETLSVLFNCFS